MKAYQRKLIAGILSTAVLLMVTACGSNQPEPKLHSSPVQSSSNAYPVTIQNYDYLENQVGYTYRKSPERVVVTHPGATELLLEFGLENRIAATIAPYGRPVERLAAKYEKLKITKAQYMPSAEELLELQPDMIIGWVQQFAPTGMGEVQTWQSRGVGTYILPSTLVKTKPTLETMVYQSITDIGNIFNIQLVTDNYIQNLRNRVAKVQAAVKDIPHKKTAIILQDHFNGTFSIYDNQYLITHLLELAGGINLCKNRTSFVSAEKVLAFDPDVVIFVSVNKHSLTEDLSDEEAVKSLQSVSELRSMRAIQQGNIINLPFFTVNNGGIRMIDAVEKIAVGLYSDRFH